jgi:hypothetical protein
MSLIIVNGFTFNCIVLYQIKENLMILKKLWKVNKRKFKRKKKLMSLIIVNESYKKRGYKFSG